jgi:hypothetical protein
MSGAVITYVTLAAYEPLVALVPLLRIFVGDTLPVGTAVPALLITEISGVPRNTVSMDEPNRLISTRVQVSVHARSYPEQDQILSLVRAAMPNLYGVVAGIKVRSILPDIVGPDLSNPEASIFIKSRDFKIAYLEQ